MEIDLKEHFTCKKLLKYTLPSIIMMVFVSIYGIVDGFFVSNFAGKEQFTAVNFVWPFLQILGSIGFMFGTGGSALVAKYLGEEKKLKANQTFSLIIYVSIIVGIIVAIIGLFIIEPILKAIGAEGLLLKDALSYGRIIIIVLPFYVIQMEFQSFFVTAGKAKLGLYSTIIAGVTNIVFDFLFIAIFKWGIVGGAVATAISQIIGGIIPMVYFIKPNTSFLKLEKCPFNIKTILKTCSNGSSELMSNISMSIVGMLYNYQLLKYAGNDGVSAYGVIMYVGMIFYAIFIGYSVGSAPIVGYHYGAQNHQEIKSLLKKGILIIGISSICMLLASELFAYPFSWIFVGYDQKLLDLTVSAFYIYSFSFLFAGFAIFFSSFFTALNDGVTSAIISFLRTLVFQIGFVIILPLLFEITGIWISIIAAELMAVIVSIIFLIIKKKKYHYLKVKVID